MQCITKAYKFGKGPKNVTSITEHKKAVKELEDDIQEKIRLHLLPERQKIIGFAVSEASVNCFALLLHRKRLISEGFSVNHRWFASIERAKEKFPFDFPHKKELLELLVREDQLRERLCYGRTKSSEEAEEAIKTFFEIKKIVKEETGDEL